MRWPQPSRTVVHDFVFDVVAGFVIVVRTSMVDGDGQDNDWVLSVCACVLFVCFLVWGGGIVVQKECKDGESIVKYF